MHYRKSNIRTPFSEIYLSLAKCGTASIILWRSSRYREKVFPLHALVLNLSPGGGDSCVPWFIWRSPFPRPYTFILLLLFRCNATRPPRPGRVIKPVHFFRDRNNAFNCTSPLVECTTNISQLLLMDSVLHSWAVSHGKNATPERIKNVGGLLYES